MIFSNTPQFVFAYLLHCVLRYFWAMKVFVAYLLALYVVMLSCIPCQDDVARCPGQEEQSVVVHDAGGGHSEALDLCSPFCICACCAGVTIAKPVPGLPETKFVSRPPIAGIPYLSPIYAGDLAGIWQPPKIQV